MGYCKHQWEERTDVLREVFWNGERRSHHFYVCARCLRIDEVNRETMTSLAVDVLLNVRETEAEPVTVAVAAKKPSERAA